MSIDQKYPARVGRCSGDRCDPAKDKMVKPLTSIEPVTREDTVLGWYCQVCHPSLWLGSITPFGDADAKKQS